jgi:hypothetical protein
MTKAIKKSVNTEGGFLELGFMELYGFNRILDVVRILLNPILRGAYSANSAKKIDPYFCPHIFLKLG